MPVDELNSAPPPPHALTLLLNSSFEPLRAISWRCAVKLQFRGSVDVVETYDLLVRSPSQAWPVPAVVRLHRYVNHRNRGPRFCRRNVFIRDDWRCQYCGRRGDYRSLTFDHVVPRHMGGDTSWENIVTCCVSCNRRKGGRTPSQAGMRLRRLPNRPNWLVTGHDGLHIERPPEEWRNWLVAA